MELSKEQRKERIAELRKHHEKTFEALGIPNAYYCCKLAHYAKDGDTEKVIGLYPSEVEKGDDVYVEFCTFDYTPVDTNRRLYVWKHRSQDSYEMKKSQYLIPVSELSVVDVSEDKTSSKEESEGVKRYTKIETVQVSYKEQTFVSISGARVKITWREGELFEYTYHTERGAPASTKLSGVELLDTYNFFKQLNKEV